MIVRIDRKTRLFEMFNERDNAKNIHAENVMTSYERDQTPFMSELEPKPNANIDAENVRKRNGEGRKMIISKSNSRNDKIVLTPRSQELSGRDARSLSRCLQLSQTSTRYLGRGDLQLEGEGGGL